MILFKKSKIYIIAFLAGILGSVIMVTGVLERFNLTLSDLLYQKGRSTERRIVILGIDKESLEYFGPIQGFTRDIYADTISLLNAEEEKPAVIGIDVLFAGETEDEIDNYLTDTCKESGNIVVVNNVQIESEIIEQSGNIFSVNDYAIASIERPYSSLMEATTQGFWNNMIDMDGIIRSGILHFDSKKDTLEDSFSYAVYKQYAKTMGLPDQIDDLLPMNSRYQWYVPFSTKPGEYEYYSLSDLYTGNLTGEELANCIVLIGPYTEGMYDSYLTAIDHSKKMFGVEIHANMIDAMIDQDFKQYTSNYIQVIFLFLIIVASVLLFYKLKLLYASIWWLFFSVGYLGIAKIFYQNDQVVKVLYIPLFISILYIAEVGVKYIQEVVEKQKVVNTFKRYVAPQVVDEIFRSDVDLELGGKMTDIACLFVDIRGFTPMSEVLTPTQIVEILNRYLNLTNACIMNNEGTLDKFIGDATMAIYNAPLPLDDYIYKAVKTGWEMVQGSTILKAELEEKYGRTVSFGVGIHCGKAVVGNIGTPMRMDYTAIGDTVNTAARLESNAKPGEVLISRAVYDALKGRIKATSLGDSIKLKGKSEGFEVLRLDEVL